MIYFSDFFKVPSETIESYGAFDISLITDLPLFIDPFHLFGSKNLEYLKLHDQIIEYLSFLKNKAGSHSISEAERKAWFMFPEVAQNWLGFTKTGNNGKGLGPKFASTLSVMMPIIFADLGKEKISQTSHLEKAGLFSAGIGRDNISDFTTNLIKDFLLTYTETFAKQYLDARYLNIHNVNKVYFDYTLERWMPKKFTLPTLNGDFVLLTPLDLLTKEETWINTADMKVQFLQVCNGIPNDQLRGEINRYFRSKLPPITKSHPRITHAERSDAMSETFAKFPAMIDYYIKFKEGNKDGATAISKQHVRDLKGLLQGTVNKLIEAIKGDSTYEKADARNSYEEGMARVQFLKHIIENNDGYKIFYVKDLPVKREEHLQLIFKLTWYATELDVNSEVNNGRGPVDFKISHGKNDTTLVEFKLASNSQLKKNLANQLAVYEKANPGAKSIKVILVFTFEEELRLKSILKELRMVDDESIIIIDARRDNKLSGSKS